MANLNKIEDPSFLIRGRRPAENLPPRAIDGADEAAVEATAAGAPVAPDAHDHHIGCGAEQLLHRGPRGAAARADHALGERARAGARGGEVPPGPRVAALRWTPRGRRAAATAARLAAPGEGEVPS